MTSIDSANASAFEPWEPGVSETDIGYSIENVTSNESQSDKEYVSTEIICDDGDPCTIDRSNGTACIYKRWIAMIEMKVLAIPAKPELALMCP